MKSKLILLVGPPCSGKSSWSRNYVLNTPRTLRFNRDDLRLSLRGRMMLDTLDEYVITGMIDAGIASALAVGRDVILDQTNCKLKYIDRFVKVYGDNPSIEIKFKILNECSIETLLERNIIRAKETGLTKIPEQVIEHMHKNLQVLLANDEFKKLLDTYGCLD